MRRTNPKDVLVAGFALALAACADGVPIVADDVEDRQPLGNFHVALNDDLPAGVSSPHLGLVWITAIGPGFEEPGFAAESVPLTAGLDQATLSVFQGPPREVLREIEGLTIALGTVIAFDDVDGDGRFGITEEGYVENDIPFGFAERDFLVWLELAPGTELPEGVFTNPEAFVPGLSRARLTGCFGPLELVPITEPVEIVTFDPAVGPLLTDDACYSEPDWELDWEECMAICADEAEAAHAWCVQEYGKDLCGTIEDFVASCDDACADLR